MAKNDFGKEVAMKKFDRLVSTDSKKAREVIKNLNFKSDPYLQRCIALTYRDEAIFNDKNEMRRVFLKTKLNLAKKYIDSAFELNNTCRDVLYLKGTIYNALGETLEAIDCYIKILEYGENMEQQYNCSKSDLSFVQMIYNDSYFQLYRLFHDLEHFELSNKFLIKYKKGLKKGINTIYKPIEKFLM